MNLLAALQLAVSQPEDDDIKAHWDKLVVSAKSFPCLYWDKFIKKRVSFLLLVLTLP